MRPRPWTAHLPLHGHQVDGGRAVAHENVVGVLGVQHDRVDGGVASLEEEDGRKLGGRWGEDGG